MRARPSDVTLDERERGVGLDPRILAPPVSLPRDGPDAENDRHYHTADCYNQLARYRSEGAPWWGTRGHGRVRSERKVSGR